MSGHDSPGSPALWAWIPNRHTTRLSCGPLRGGRRGYRAGLGGGCIDSTARVQLAGQGRLRDAAA